MNDDEPLAVLYIGYKTRHYRLKVFKETTWIEQQPTGANVPVSRTYINAYDDVREEWDYEGIGALIAYYDT